VARHERILVTRGDITEQTVGAIVNAANSSLLGGGGVDGAIHRAGGPAILEECRLLGGCETGDAKATTAGNLDAEYVIHTVGPVWVGGRAGEEEQLASCHRRSLEVAAELGVRTVAFPAISTGAYAFPVDRAARVAVDTTADELERHLSIEAVTFVLFSEDLECTFGRALEEAQRGPAGSAGASAQKAADQVRHLPDGPARRRPHADGTEEVPR
jgi:O-acetyl-ADP-ribose deacetylase (regulator of RNase III)